MPNQKNPLRLMSLMVATCGSDYCLGYGDNGRTDRKKIEMEAMEVALSDLGFDVSNSFKPCGDIEFYLQEDIDSPLGEDEQYEWVSVELQFARKVSTPVAE